MFSLVGYVMVLLRMHDGVVVELIALPALALFYLVCSYFLLRPTASAMIVAPSRSNWTIGLGVAAGLGFAYCLISLMRYTLHWQPWLDTVENSAIILILLSAITIWKRKALGVPFTKGLLTRSAIILAVIGISAFLPFTPTGFK